MIWYGEVEFSRMGKNGGNTDLVCKKSMYIQTNKLMNGKAKNIYLHILCMLRYNNNMELFLTHLLFLLLKDHNPK